MWRRSLFVVGALLVLASSAFGQGAAKYDQVIVSSFGQLIPAAGATIRVCSAGSTGIPCSPLASIYSDLALTVPLSNPTTTDANGNYHFFASSLAAYDIQITGTGISPITQTSVTLTCATGCPGLSSGNIFTGNNTFNGQLNSNDLSVGNVANKPVVSDAVLFVSINGSDSNDGFSWGTAKLTIAAALSALPSCEIFHYYIGSYSTASWTNCGKIEVGAGIFPVTSLISISSPFVTIEGRSAVSTTLSVIGSTGGIFWTSNPFVDEFNGSGGLYRLTIDGFGAGAGAYGLQTNDISGFHARDIVIQNFTGAGDVCWLDSATNEFNEKDDVEVTIKNCTNEWEIKPASSAPGYPETTFGYGVFDVKMETWSGQTGLLMVNGALQESIVHMTVNQASTPANASAIVLQNNAFYGNNVSMVHIETPGGIGTGAEVNVATSAGFVVTGSFSQQLPASNVINGTFSPSTTNTVSYPVTTSETWGNTGVNSFGLLNNAVQNAARSSGWMYGTYLQATYTGSGTNAGNFFGSYGVGIQQGAGTMLLLQGVGGQVAAQNATGTVTAGQAFRALTPSINGSGAITNAYGFYIEAQKTTGVTNGFGIYQAGANDTNYFAGPVELVSSGGGGVNHVAPPTASLFTITDPALTGTSALTVENVALRQQQLISDQGIVLANGNIGTLTGWGTSASAAVCASPGYSQTGCFTITSGSGSFVAAPTVTVTLPNALPSANTLCGLRVVDITGSGGAIMWNETTVSATAPVFTAKTNTGAAFTPAASETYTMYLECGP